MIQSNSTLTSLINRLIPEDDFPNAENNGVLDFLARFLGPDRAELRRTLELGCRLMERESEATFGHAIKELSATQLDALITQVQQGQVRAHWSIDPQPFMAELITLTAEGYYSDPENGGNPEGLSWRMLGFERRLAPPGAHNFTNEDRLQQNIISWQMVADEYETIVVGAGAGGGIAAGLLAEAGQQVLVIERGQWLPTPAVSRDHLRNHRLSRYGHNTGPELEGNPRELSDGQLVPPYHGAYQNNAMTVGGGTRVYGAQAWRFHPHDFRMASIYGVPEHSSLADWPLQYEDLAPFYERVEWEVGVAGSDTGFRGQGGRARGYPMPPVPANPASELLQGGAARLGWDSAPVPLLINTRPYLGRSACVQCGECVGFACPSNSKNGSHNTMLPRALATGNCALLTEAQVTSLQVGSTGQVVGVVVRALVDGVVVEKRIRARRVVLAAGAIETARLLLNSRSSHHPHGIGNDSDQVGRHLQGHLYPAAYGRMPGDVHDNKGPGVSIATCDFNHGNAGIVGGGMLANEFVVLPIIFWHKPRPDGIPTWGLANKQYMRQGYRQVCQVTGPVQEIPQGTARVTLSKTRDQMGMPVAKLSGTVHPESYRTAEFMRQKAIMWLRAAGATELWGQSYETLPLRLTGGQHQAGTCRMGDDPQTSVTDKWGRVHGQENLFICDGSVHVTNGGFNPVLTIMALAWRNALAISKPIM